MTIVRAARAPHQGFPSAFRRGRADLPRAMGNPWPSLGLPREAGSDREGTSPGQAQRVRWGAPGTRAGRLSAIHRPSAETTFSTIRPIESVSEAS